MPFSPPRQWHRETCRRKVGPTAAGTGMGTKHPGTHAHLLVTKSSLAKLLASSVAEKAPGVLADPGLPRSQQGALAQRRRRVVPWAALGKALAAAGGR